MSIPTLNDLFNAAVSETFSNEPVPVGFYDAVITKVEVRQGAKGPYLSIENTIHAPEEYKSRKVWRNSSFSEKALYMPGGIAQLLQATQPEVDRNTSAEEMPAVIARGIQGLPVRIEVEHEQVVRNGQQATNADGSPEMRATVRSFETPDPAFVQAIEDEASGLDDDLPF